MSLVTGVKRGICAAYARLFARQAAALAARREDRLIALAAELGEGALPTPTDVSVPAACAALVDRTLERFAVERFGSLEVLINNAELGLYGSVAGGAPENWRTWRTWRKMFEVNVLGVLYTTRAVGVPDATPGRRRRPHRL